MKWQTQSMPPWLSRLYREAAAQPAKLAVLLGLAVVALVLWGRRLPGLVAGASDKAGLSAGVSGATLAGVSELQVYPAGLGEVTAAEIATRAIGWMSELRALLAGTIHGDSDNFSEEANPFRPGVTTPAPDGGSPVDASPDAAGQREVAGPQAQPAPSRHPQVIPGKVRAIIITDTYRGAIVDDTMCLLLPGGDPPRIRLRVDEADEEYAVISIDSDGVMISRNNRTLWLPAGKQSSRVQVRSEARQAPLAVDRNTL